MSESNRQALRLWKSMSKDQKKAALLVLAALGVMGDTYKEARKYPKNKGQTVTAIMHEAAFVADLNEQFLTEEWDFKKAHNGLTNGEVIYTDDGILERALLAVFHSVKELTTE